MAAPIKTHASGLDVEIVVGSYEQVLFGYSLSSSEDEAKLKLSFTDKSHCASVRALAVSSNRLLASGSADETIQLFNLKTRQEAGTLMKHSGTITAIEFHDEFMLSSDDVGTICIWKILGKSFECLKTMTGHRGSVLSLAVHPTGKLLLSVGQDRTIRTWNLVTAKRAYTTSTPAPVDIVKWTPGGDKYVLCYNGKLDVCSVSNAATIHSIKLPGKAHSVAFISDNVIAAGCEGGKVCFLDLESGQSIHDFKVNANRIKCISVKQVESNKNLLALITNDGIIELHLVEQNKSEVTNTLVVATKTVLRPVCMEMVAVTTDQEADEQAEDGTPEVKGQTNSDTITKVSNRKRASLDQSSANGAQAKNKRNKKSAERLEQTVETNEDMDKIKKLLTSKSASKGDDSSDTEGDNHRKPNKLHMKQVDSVKIAKQKMAGRKKQHRAQHHHIVEESSSQAT